MGLSMSQMARSHAYSVEVYFSRLTQARHLRFSLCFRKKARGFDHIFEEWRANLSKILRVTRLPVSEYTC